MAAITKIRPLRTGSGESGAKTASGDDEYMVQVDTQLGWRDVLTLWYALTDPIYPKPYLTYTTVGGRLLVCEKLSIRNVNNQRYIWSIKPIWVDASAQDKDEQTSPYPQSDSETGDDWTPTVTRRPVTLQEPAESLFYESGYTGGIHSDYGSNTTAGDRSPYTNSARIPFRDQLPAHQRRQSLWTIRWLRSTVPSSLIDAELHINEETVTFAFGGYTEIWDGKTAKIESVGLTRQKVRNAFFWEIVVEILHDADGHVIKSLDQGLHESYGPSEPMPNGDAGSTTRLWTIRDGTSRPIREPVLLDGGGKRLTSMADGVYATWRDLELVDFNTVDLVKDLVS